MLEFFHTRNYIVAKNHQEVEEAKQCQLCTFIIQEVNDYIFLWEYFARRWHRKIYHMSEISNDVEPDKTTGLEAYRLFFNYCGRDEVNKMKAYYTPIEKWESYEQLHYYNSEFANQKIFKNIYEYDANSAFTYGALQLPEVFIKLKEYMLSLYRKKEKATSKSERTRYKNLMNFLVGYFARIKDLVSVRSEIINYSNINIKEKMVEIFNNGGIVYLSNTDSIVTDERGADILEKYKGTDVGLFKLEKKVDKLYYVSSNAYQLGNDIKYSGVKFFARKHTDFINDIVAKQSGNLVNEYDFCIDGEGIETKLCRVEKGIIYVDIYSTIGEYIKSVIYRL